MMHCWMLVIGLHIRCFLVVVCVNVGHVVDHGLVVVVLRRSRYRRAQGHRRESEALQGHRQQHQPNNQDFQQVFHEAILAHAKVTEIGRYPSVTLLAICGRRPVDLRVQYIAQPYRANMRFLHVLSYLHAPSISSHLALDDDRVDSPSRDCRRDQIAMHDDVRAY
jgi:hypothetical protein